jgi:quinoprotein glucose dehydrogenase
VRGTVIFPGNIGGSNWSGVSIDPVRHLAIVPSNRIVTVVDLIPRLDLHERMMGGTRFDEFAPQAGTPSGCIVAISLHRMACRVTRRPGVS